MSARLDQLEPWLEPWARYLFNALAPYGAQLTSTRRTSAEQAQLYRNYLAGYSKYPALPPGRSMHERGRAFDIVAPAWLLEYAGRWWESVGGRWGGRDGSDPIHFEA